MSLKTLFNCIKYTLSQYKQNNQKEPKQIQFEEKLREIRFTDISASFPEKYFLIDFEPLYSYPSILSSYPKKKLGYILLEEVYNEKQI